MDLATKIVRRKQEWNMWDIGCLCATVVFFLIAIAYVESCNRLTGKEVR
jgi:hypothetical protein